MTDLARHQRLVNTGFVLVLITLLYNSAETFLALYAAYRDNSLSLEAFGLDSIIEWGLGFVLLRRLRIEGRGADAASVDQAERNANRWAGWAFYSLAAIIGGQSLLALATQQRADPGWLGIGLAIASLIVMPVLAAAKSRVGRTMGSRALVAEANCTWVCVYMSATLLVGLLATRFVGWWWADPLTALGILYWVIKEGKESFDRAAGRGTCCGGHDG